MNDEQAGRAANVLFVIANTARIEMVEVMTDGEIMVGDLAQKVGLSTSATSQHLKHFKEAGLLVQRRYQQSRYCAIIPDKIETLLNMIQAAKSHLADPVAASRRP